MSNESVFVSVPATSANVGPGFDVLGLALNIYANFVFCLQDKGLEIKGCPKEFANEQNLTYFAFCKTLEHCGKNKPSGLSIEIKSNIPIARGLGSSSALTVAGIVAANTLYNLGLDKNEELLIATEIEGHPDNAAPCIFGGFVSSYISNGKCFETHHTISPELKFAVIIPDYEVSTEQARAILPQSISRKDAVFSLAHYGMLIKGFSSCDSVFLKEALDDKIHQPYRKNLIKDFDLFRESSIVCGAFGLVISGSGSTMLVVGDSKTDFVALKSTVSKVSPKASFVLVDPCLEGTLCQMIS